MKALIKINGVEIEISAVSESDKELQSVVNYIGVAFAAYAKYLTYSDSQELAHQAQANFQHCLSWCSECGYYERTNGKEAAQ